jgi:hypothetical protein
MATQAPPKTPAQGTWVARPPRMAKDASGINPEDRHPIHPKMPHLPPA